MYNDNDSNDDDNLPLSNVAYIVYKHSHIMYPSERYTHVFENLPVVAYHHPNNSSDIFVRAQLLETDNCLPPPRATPGSFWCNSSKCTTCPYIDHGLLYLAW